MQTSFDGRVVVITGASSGVGRACAREFGKRGARVGLIARNEEALDVAAREIRESGGEAMVLPLDLANADAVHAAADRVVDVWGAIDTWINAAMLTVFAPVAETTSAEYQRVMEGTYLGYVYGTQAALRHMRRQKRGNIVQVGSALAYRSIPLQSAYCAAKAATRGFTDSLRTELIHEGSHIKLSMIHLPAVNTPQATRQRNKLDFQPQPVPPMFTPESMAEVIADAVQTMPREMLVGWPTVKAVWGHSIAPWFADWYLGRTGYSGQMTNIRTPRDAPDILFETLPGDPGAHGPYVDKERGPDWQMRLQGVRRGVMAATGLALLAFGLARRWT